MNGPSGVSTSNGICFAPTAAGGGIDGSALGLSAAELEMMNLTGDGTGLDMVTMPQAMREQVPTSNFFQRGGYERNPVAIRHNTVAKLLAITDSRMDSNSNLPGAKELAAAF